MKVMVFGGFQFFESANSPDLFKETMCVCGSVFNERHSGMSQSTEMQKQMLGEKLYPMVAKYQPELVARCESSQIGRAHV